MQSMRKVHESLTPTPPLAALFFVSPILFRSLMRLSILLRLPRPLFFPSSFLQRSTIFTLLLPIPSLYLFLSHCGGRSALLTRLSFNPSTLRSIATLLYLLRAQSLCSLVDCSSLLLAFEKALSYRQDRVTSNSRYVQG